MGKGPITIGERDHGICVACHAKFVGPGERCPPCARLVRVKAAAKRRRRHG